MIGNIDKILSVHQEQGAPQAVVDEVRALHADEDRIDAGGFLPAKALELKRERRAKAVATITEHLRTLEADAEKKAALEVELHDRKEHERVSKADGQGAIDLARVKAATSPVELRVLMKDAMVYSVEGAQRAYKFVRPVLWEMARREQRQHIIGTRHTAFGVLNQLDEEMRDLTRRNPDRTAVAEAGERRTREIRDKVLAVAKTVGLDQLVEAAARKAALPEPAKSEGTFTVGGWFDRFNNRK
jgi:hypothetical protein